MSLTADANFGRWNSIYFFKPIASDGWLVVSAVRKKPWKEAVEFCKVLIPGNDENRGNLSEGSQPCNWTQS